MLYSLLHNMILSAKESLETIIKSVLKFSLYSGLFTGCFVALLAGYIIVAHLTGMYRQHSENTFYMETAYPVLRRVI